MKKIVLFLISVLFFGALYAQESPQADTLGVKVYFRKGYSILEPAYRDNGARLDAFAAQLEALQRDTLIRVKRIRVAGTASPEGTAQLNVRLSENRAKNIIAWFGERFSFPGISFDVHAEGIDWAGLAALVESSEMPYRDEVLIKVLLHICKPNVYQRFAAVFYALFPCRLPPFCMVLRPPACFACAVAVSPCMTVQI